MTTNMKRCLGLAALMLLSGLAGSAQVRAETCEMPRSIRFSMIPSGEVEKDMARYQPLLKRIEQTTGRPVSLVRPSSYAAVVVYRLAFPGHGFATQAAFRMA